MRKSMRLARYIRWVVLFGILGFISLNAVMKSIEKSMAGHNVHTVCPFGGIESLYSFITTKTLLNGIAYSSFVILVALLVVAVFMGRGFCGWICPLGALQELFTKMGFVVFKKRFTLPDRADKILKYLKYLVLVLVVAGTWAYGTLIIKSIDPWSSYLSILGLSGGGEYIYIGISLLIALLVLSLFYERFFCRYICPLGAIIAIVSLLSPSKIHRNEERCINCGICNNVCPIGIDIMHSKTVGTAECISCQLCTTNCPIKGALEIRFAKKKLHPITYGVIVLIIFFSIILGSVEAGLYNTTPMSLKTVAKLSKAALTPEAIRGSSTLKEISESFSIPLKKLYKALKLDEKKIPPTMKLKDIKEKVKDFKPDKVREVVEKLLKK